MKFQGDVASIPIMDVVQNLSANLKSGVLTVRQGDHVRRLFLKQGKIVSHSDNDGFSIPEWFHDKGFIDDDAFHKATKRFHKAKKKSFGEIVEQLGGPDLESWFRHVQNIFLEEIYETFSYREGTFEFEERDIKDDEIDRDIAAAGLEIPVRAVMMEAARRMDHWEAIRRSLPSENDIYQIGSSDLAKLQEEFAEDPVALATIALIDGTRSIREVVTRAPAAKFDASQVIADLVSRKIARPLAGDELVRQIGAASNGTPNSTTLIRLKAALEREPSNHALLEKVAELSLSEGHREDSAVYYKMLAQGFLDAERPDEAIREMRRSLDLNPRDLATWQKLYDLVETSGADAEIVEVGRALVSQVRAMGLNELARDHLARMIKRFPADVGLRLEQADAIFVLGERADAIKRLLDLARDLFQAGKRDDAETVLAKVIEYDPHHKRAREIYDKIRSGKLERQRKRRRAMLRFGVAAVATAAVGFFLGYDLFVRTEMSRLTRDVFAAGLATPDDYARARKRIAELEEAHPYSLLRFIEAREIRRALDEGETSSAPPRPADPRVPGPPTPDRR